jgi:oxygen-independent coproporphyrinogen-3 oxidase
VRRPVRSPRPRTTGLYVHLPFCASRCSYCTFVTSTELSWLPRLLQATSTEVARYAGTRRSLATLYLGGGTPSLVPVDLLERLTAAIRSAFDWLDGGELTLEANPDDVSAERVEAWRRIGVTRLSIGVQSFDDRVLRLLNRRHDAATARRAAEVAMAAGLAVSIDLMLGLPGMAATELEGSLAEVRRLRPNHVSVYLLETDKPHALGALAQRNPSLFPDADAAAAQYLATGRALVAAGYRHYEISNFALPGHQARHNLRYWLGRPVIAAGVAAHGQSGRMRWANHAGMGEYLADVEGGRPPRAWIRRLDDADALRERVMMGMRLACGVSADDVEQCGRLAPPFAVALGDFLSLGLARRQRGRVRCTPRGWLVSSELLAALW